MTALRYYWIGGIIWWFTPLIIPLWVGIAIPFVLLSEGDSVGAMAWFALPPVPIGWLCWLHDSRMDRS